MSRSQSIPEPPSDEIVLLDKAEWALRLYDRPDGISRIVFEQEGTSVTPRIGETITLRIVKIVRESEEV